MIYKKLHYKNVTLRSQPLDQMCQIHLHQRRIYETEEAAAGTNNVFWTNVYIVEVPNKQCCHSYFEK